LSVVVVVVVAVRTSLRAVCAGRKMALAVPFRRAALRGACGAPVAAPHLQITK